MRMMVWPLEMRFSVAHFSASWLLLSLSMATATSPVFPFLLPKLLLPFALESHIFLPISFGTFLASNHFLVLGNSSSFLFCFVPKFRRSVGR